MPQTPSVFLRICFEVWVSKQHFLITTKRHRNGKASFLIDINAAPEKVWAVLWDADSYKQWTTAFGEGSYAETDGLKQGSEVRFLDAKGEGLLSEVTANRPYEAMHFTHRGMVRNSV